MVTVAMVTDSLCSGDCELIPGCLPTVSLQKLISLFDLREVCFVSLSLDFRTRCHDTSPVEVDLVLLIYVLKGSLRLAYSICST